MCLNSRRFSILSFALLALFVGIAGCGPTGGDDAGNHESCDGNDCDSNANSSNQSNQNNQSHQNNQSNQSNQNNQSNQSNQCDPLTPEDCGANDCGDVDDGCGGTVDCGECEEACEAADPCEEENLQCGQVIDECGDEITCGSCDGGASCEDNMCITDEPFEEIEFWTGNGGSEVWLKVVPTFSGTIGAYSLEGDCSTQTTFFEVPVMSEGHYSVFQLLDNAFPPCEPGEYELSVDYYEESNPSQVQMFTATLTPDTEFWPGESVLTDLVGFDGTTGGLRLDAHAERDITLYQIGLYNNDGELIGHITSMDGIPVSSGEGLIDTGMTPPSEPGDYFAYFRGEDSDGTEYFQYTSFEYDP